MGDWGGSVDGCGVWGVGCGCGGKVGGDGVCVQCLGCVITHAHGKIPPGEKGKIPGFSIKYSTRSRSKQK